MKKVLFSAALLAASFGSAQAQTEILGTTAGDWTIVRDADIGGGCYMQSQFADGTFMQLGYDKNNDVTFMSAFNPGWDFADGESYNLVLDIDGQPYDAEVHGFAVEGAAGLALQIGNEDFLFDLMKGHKLTLAEDGSEIIAYSLVGTMEAIPAVSACLEG